MLDIGDDDDDDDGFVGDCEGGGKLAKVVFILDLYTIGSWPSNETSDCDDFMKGFFCF